MTACARGDSILTTYQMTVMKYLWQQAAPAGKEEIVKETGHGTRNVTRWLDRMEGQGLIRKENDGYIPLKTATECGSEEIRGLVDGLYNGDAVDFLKDYITIAKPEDRAALEMALQKDEGDRQM